MSIFTSQRILIWFSILLLVNCGTSFKESDIEKWPELLFIVDTRFEIHLVVPPAKMEAELLRPQFIAAPLEDMQRLFVASYDPGSWSNRGLLITSISANIIRVEKKLGYSLEDIKNDIYLARPEAKEFIDVSGEVSFNERPWLHVNLVGGTRKGIAYSTVIDDEYVLIVSMSIYGENADQTRLYRTRKETLSKVVNSVQIIIE